MILSPKDIAIIKFLNEHEFATENEEKYIELLEKCETIADVNKLDKKKQFELVVKYNDIDWDDSDTFSLINIPEDMKDDDAQYEHAKWVCYTDEEADEAFEDALDYHIEEIIFPEIPEMYHTYFDTDRWKDAAKYEGRGATLGKYDGQQDELDYDGETYYFYRIA